MARRAEKTKAITLRKKGYSYSQIKEKMGIPKSTLSGWLSDYPLSEKRLRELRDTNPRRIENYIATMRAKRENRLSEVYEKAKLEIGELTDRDIFVSGLFLYWGEGLKSGKATTGFANTDPASCRFFMSWLRHFKVTKEKINVRIQLYSDMNTTKEVKFWSEQLKFPEDEIKVRVKESKFSSITYINGFKHGTCNINVYNRDLSEYILMSLKYLREYSNNMRA